VSEGSSYRNIALAAIGETVAQELLASKSAIVLERIARGGGATSWYLVRAPGDLDALVERLKPGSSVSFYFDDRLSVGPFNDETLASLLAIIERDGNAVIGAVRDDEIEIKVDFPGSEEAAGEFVADHPDATLMHGSSPGRDNDGNRAVTLTLPDLDGVVRSHPH
jgi:hypothetical protein